MSHQFSFALYFLFGSPTSTLPWQYLNRFERQNLIRAGDKAQLEFNDGLTLSVDLSTGWRTIHHDVLLLEDGTDLFVPALWQKQPEIIAFSKEGYASRWGRLPESWEGVECVDLRAISAEGLAGGRSEAVVGGSIELDLQPGQALWRRRTASSSGSSRRASSGGTVLRRLDVSR